MADQAALKKILQELSKREDLGNKICNDCSNPNPQWASLSFAIFICLQCAGTHRGFGVHISFVRSISMDTWTEDQIKRMQLGGNTAFKDFIGSYPAQQGGYKPDGSSYDNYHCWAATQYREKLDATLAGKEWTSSQPLLAADSQNRTSSPSPAAQTLRKSRTSTRTATGRSASPSPFRGSPRSTPNPTSDQRTGNEAYFENLGKMNEHRPDHLPPSQGGRYTGFGNTPTPVHPLSSQAAPTLSELQENPLGAITKGWSLFSAAVVGASKAVSENVIQPGVEKITDPNFQANVKGYVSEAQKRAVIAGEAANSWSKNQFGVDVAESVGGVVGTVKDRIGGPSRAGYGALPMEHDGETSALYHDGEEDNFFGQYSHDFQQGGASTQGSSLQNTKSGTGAGKKSDWDDDDWKDF